jgi:hypothetical protein
MLLFLNKSTPGAAWVPEPDVTNHAGQPIPENSDFFAPPPIEIGRIISAETTLIKHEEPPLVRLIRLCKLSIMIFIGILLSPVTIPLLCILFFLRLNDYILWMGNSNQHNRFFCTYIGEHGLAVLSVKGRKWSRPKSELFLFQDEVALYSEKVELKVNGIYRQTKYYFHWMRGRQKLYKIAGVFHKHKKLRFDHMLQFGDAAKIAWNRYLQSKLTHQLEHAGYVEFMIRNRLGSFTAIRVGAEFVEFVSRKGEPKRVLKSEIQSICLRFGGFALVLQAPNRDRELKWARKCFFRYENVGNVQFFMFLMENLLKISIN